MAERNEKGQFVKGEYKGGPGRPPKEREERYYTILMTTCTFADWKRIIEKAVEQARRGDAQARKWLADYLVGAAEQRLDITTGGESLNLIEVKGVDYRTAIANLAPGSMGDSDASGKGESSGDGSALG